MSIKDDMETGISREKSVLANNVRTILFKEEYLSNLIEAEAPLEVARKMIAQHNDIQMNPKAIMGVSILPENITKLIDINTNLVNDHDTAANTFWQEAIN